MKKIIILLTMILLLFSCNQQNKIKNENIKNKEYIKENDKLVNDFFLLSKNDFIKKYKNIEINKKNQKIINSFLETNQKIINKKELIKKIANHWYFTKKIELVKIIKNNLKNEKDLENIKNYLTILVNLEEKIKQEDYIKIFNNQNTIKNKENLLILLIETWLIPKEIELKNLIKNNNKIFSIKEKLQKQKKYIESFLEKNYKNYDNIDFELLFDFVNKNSINADLTVSSVLIELIYMQKRWFLKEKEIKLLKKSIEKNKNVGVYLWASPVNNIWDFSDLILNSAK